MTQAHLDSVFFEVCKERNVACIKNSTLVDAASCLESTRLCSICNKHVSKSNYSRHLENHRYCTFCSKMAGSEVYHMFKSLGECPFFETLMRKFYPRHSERLENE